MSMIFTLGQGELVHAAMTDPALFNVNGTYHAMGAIYPHEDGSLHEGEVDGVTIIYPWHRYDFTVKTGECSMDSDLQVPTSVVMTEDNDILLEVT
jgi:nitrite reductase/ring-hydroxylating ferredoxin subunit